MSYTINYIGGHPSIDKPRAIGFEIRNSSLRLTIYKNWGEEEHIRVEKEQITGVFLEEQSKRSAGKAAAGAIVGGVLTGGLGLLAGAAIGGRRKNNSKLHIGITHNEREFEMILKTGKKTEKIYAELIAMLGS